MAILWTQADIDRLRAAILALASGEAVQIVRYDGPPQREVTYHAVNLSAMRDLLAEMNASVQAQSGTPRTRYAATKKGFGSR